MQSETLMTLIGKIRVQRVRLTQSANTTSTAPWTYEEEFKLEELIDLYGTDFALLQNYFPDRSRKQIRRKCMDMEQRWSKKQQKMEMRRIREQRKNYFDETILECNLIKWPKKPNFSESSSSQDSL